VKKSILSAAILSTSMVGFLAPTTSFAASEACQPGEIVIKFSHVTNTDKHPKGIAASLLEERVNKEMDGKACMEVFPNSTLYDDNKVLEALLQGDVQNRFTEFDAKERATGSDILAQWYEAAFC